MDALRHPFRAGAHGKPKGTVKVKYARLGNTGVIVSKLAFGAMNFGEDQTDFGFQYKLADAVLRGEWPHGR